MKRPQFNLRTVFVFMAILALPLGWLGWQANIVQHRRSMREFIEANGGIIFAGGDIEFRHSPLMVTVRPADYGFKISPTRTFFEDQFVFLIAFRRQLTNVDREAIEAFPESEVVAIP